MRTSVLVGTIAALSAIVGPTVPTRDEVGSVTVKPPADTEDELLEEQDEAEEQPELVEEVTDEVGIEVVKEEAETIEYDDLLGHAEEYEGESRHYREGFIQVVTVDSEDVGAVHDERCRQSTSSSCA